jgi:N-acetylmuramoyl-L-alanine amidase
MILKNSLKYVSFCALLLACVLTGSHAFLAIEATFQSASTDAPLPGLPVIILDAGHGGEDCGAIGSNGVLEKELNLSLTEDLAALLRGGGFTVVQTRTDDSALFDPAQGTKHKKQRDLNARLAIVEQHQDAIFVSIHMNTFPNDTCRGTQVWYSPNDPRSVFLAQGVQDTVKNLLQPQNNRKVKQATSGIYLLRHITIPAILVECGFLSNPEECGLLSQKDYQSRLCFSIFCGMMEYMENKGGSVP